MLLLAATSVPYFALYARDLRLLGRRRRDLLGVYALNLLMLPVNLGGVVMSIRQGLTGQRIPFGRTPKVADRTAAPALYIALTGALLALWGTGAVIDCLAGRYLHPAMGGRRRRRPGRRHHPLHRLAPRPHRPHRTRPRPGRRPPHRPGPAPGPRRAQRAARTAPRPRPTGSGVPAVGGREPSGRIAAGCGRLHRGRDPTHAAASDLSRRAAAGEVSGDRKLVRAGTPADPADDPPAMVTLWRGPSGQREPLTGEWPMTQVRGPRTVQH